MNKFWINKSGEKKPIGDFDFEYNLDFNIDEPPFSFEVDTPKNWSELRNETLHGIWKYEPILPISKEIATNISNETIDELSNPIEIPELAELLGVKQFYLFPCLNGKAGNFKDVEAAFVIGKILDWKCATPISFHSTGNTARAYREYAISAGLKSVSFFPLECINKFIGATENSENKLFAYNGSFQNISNFAKRWATENGHLHLAPFRWKVEGKVPLGYHIINSVPTTTHIIQTIAGGYGAIGIYKAIMRLKKWKMVSQLPKFELFQIKGADTISQLFPFDRDIFETDLKLQINSFEPTLQSTNPLSTFNTVRKVCSNTNSQISSISYQDVIKYSEELITVCEKYEVPLSFIDEKSPFISYAGLRINAKEKKYKGDEIISFIVTGSKQRSGTTPSIDWLINPKVEAK